jgi:hypothetical protein
MLMVSLVLVVGIHGFVRVRQERTQLLAANQRSLAVTAKAIQIALENALRDEKTFDVYRLLFEMAETQPEIDRLRLFDRTLVPTLVSNPLSIGDGVSAREVARVFETRTAAGSYRREDGQLVLFQFAPVQGHDGTTERVLEVVQLARGVETRIRSLFWDVCLRLGLVTLAPGAGTPRAASPRR